MRDLGRLLNPRTIAVIGGGAWCASIIGAARRIGFQGEIFPVHPDGKEIAGLQSFRRLEDWHGPIDAAFVGINRHATIDAVTALSQLGAGGAVCFASGFTEARAEDAEGAGLQNKLVEAADGMPILGPNCYGLINALDQVAIWPDQHGLEPVSRGVAILTQSSNIAINLTMQQRGLPIAYMVTCGNMAQTSQAKIANALLEDPRVTAIGLHVEGFADLRDWEALARRAWDKSIPLVALKVGASALAQQATISHTASLAGSDAGAQALLDRLGIPRISDLPEFLETLKLLHCIGPLPHRGIASISCSGGEASLIADMALSAELSFPDLSLGQRTKLETVLGPMVALGNPLDYHTYIWRDEATMTQAWSGMTGDGIALTLSIVDYPTTDMADWDCATHAALGVHKQTGAPFAVVSTLPELMPLSMSRSLMAGGVVPLLGLREALAATKAATGISEPSDLPLCLPGVQTRTRTLTEAQAKQEMSHFGVPTPKGMTIQVQAVQDCKIGDLQEPFVVKAVGIAHKSEHGGVCLGVPAKDLQRIAQDIGSTEVLVEEMISDPVAELLIGVMRDPAHGFVLTLAAGGVLTELLQDTQSLLLPVTTRDIRASLERLTCAPVLRGYRGRPAADMDSIVQAVEAVQAYVLANAGTVSEVEINPLICTPERAVAVDALIRKA
jgi:acyl-CoA synthetase (NDP forming)